MELPNGLSPSSFLLVKSKAWDKVQGSWFESSYYKPFFRIFLRLLLSQQNLKKLYLNLYNLVPICQKNVSKELTLNHYLSEFHLQR